MTSTDPASARTPTRRDIQGLRALAVVAVILSHVAGWPGGGFAGVDVFFVVSGFLITGLLLDEVAREGRISLRGFFARRIRRIVPAAVLVLVAVVAAGFAVFARPRAEATLSDAVAAFALVSNWWFADQGTDYFSQDAAVSPLQHFWSLSVEEQFYLVWPLLLLVVVLLVPAAARRGRGGRVAAGLAALAVIAVSAAVAAVQSFAEPDLAYFSTATRAWELAAGALVAAAAPLWARVPRPLGGLLQWIGLAGVCAALFVTAPDAPFPWPGALLPVAATALVLAGGVGGDPRARHLFPLSNPLSVGIGDASYSLYLWHFPVLVFAAVILPPGPATAGIVLVATLVLALTTYAGWEQPIHRSPWLRGRRPDAMSPTHPAPDPAPEPVPAPAASRPAPMATRPAGWSPGQRYYPGRPRPQGMPAPRAAATPGAEPAAAVATSAPAASAVPPAPAVPAAGAGAPAWRQWRARYAGRMGGAVAGLVIGAIGVVLLVQLAFGPSVLAPLVPAPAPEAEPADPVGVLQVELAEALAATEWPPLHPSLDEVMAQSSAPNRARDCFAPDVPLDAAACTWGNADAPRHLYLVGDSTAMAYAPAFARLAEESGGRWRATTVGLYGCRFTDVLVQNPDAAVMAACAQRKADVRALLSAEPADLVVVSNAYTLGRTVDGRDLSADDLLAATAREIAAYGAPGRVVYLAPPPLGGDLGACYSHVSSPLNCVTAVDDTWRAMQAAAEAVATASGDIAISSLPFTCWQDACPAFAGGLPIRYDQTHLTVPFAEHIAAVLRADLVAAGRL